MRRLAPCLLLAALASLTAGRARAADYYMTVFGAQQGDNTARSSHTWATFDAVEDGRIVAEQTISWLPAPGYFGPAYTMPPLATVPGRDYSLDETLEFMRNHQVMYWGPYRIRPDLWEKAVARVAFLDRGQTSYKMFVLDAQRRQPALYNQPGGAINCIMAVSDLGGPLSTGEDWGFAASRKVLGWLSRWADDYPWGAHEDVARRLGIRPYSCRGIVPCTPGGI